MGTKHNLEATVEDLLGDELWCSSYQSERKLNEVITHAQLMNDVLKSKSQTINWCYDKGLLCSAPNCDKCGYVMTLKKDTGKHASSQALIWSCRRSFQRSRCHQSVTIRKCSWFAKSNLTISEILHLTYAFAHSWPETAVHHEIKMAKATVVDWYNFAREVLLEICINRGEPVGGPGKTVEIDESKFGKRKYHRGHHVEGQWVFGGVERESGGIFLVPVEKRDSATLVPLIKKWILPGTTIISDCWRAYDCLKNEDYEHLTVNHSVNFIDPESGAHTNTIEGAWLHAKRSLPKYGTKKDFMGGYLATHMWRRSVSRLEKDPFLSFLDKVKDVYNPEEWKVPH